MKVIAIKRFRDMEAEKMRELGEAFNANKARAEKLVRLGLVEEATEQQNNPSNEPAE